MTCFPFSITNMFEWVKFFSTIMIFNVFIKPLIMSSFMLSSENLPFQNFGPTLIFLKGSHSSWKVMEFKIEIFQAWKVMKMDMGFEKS